MGELDWVGGCGGGSVEVYFGWVDNFYEWVGGGGGGGGVRVRLRYILGGCTTFRVGCGRWRYILGEWGGWRFSITPTKNVSVKKCKS